MIFTVWGSDNKKERFRAYLFELDPAGALHIIAGGAPLPQARAGQGAAAGVAECDSIRRCAGNFHLRHRERRTWPYITA